MEPAGKHDEQRHSFRCAVSGSRQRAELRIDRQRYPVLLLDESAGGFAVLMDCCPQTGEQSRIELHADVGGFQVQIVHVAEQEIPATDVAAEGAPQRRYRVGLTRVGDLDPPEHRGVTGPGIWLRFALASMFPDSGSILVAGAVFAVFLAAAPVVLVFMFGWVSATPASRDGAGGEYSGQTLQVTGPDKTAGGRTSGQSMGRTAASGLDDLGNHVTKTVQQSTASDRDELGRLLRGMPGAAAFTLPEVVRELGLTSQQQDRIRELSETAEAMLAEPEPQSAMLNRAQRTAKRQVILDAARRDVLSLLDEQQQALYRQLTE